MPRHNGKFGLRPDDIAAIQAVLKRHASVVQAVIYGSRAMEKHADGSDIDLTLIGTALTTDDLLAIDGELDDLLLPYKFDLSIYGHIESVQLKDHVDRVGKLFYAADERR